MINFELKVADETVDNENILTRRGPFTLMPVPSTFTLSVSVLGFNDMRRLTPSARLMRLLFVGPALCLRLPSDSILQWTPLPSG